MLPKDLQGKGVVPIFPEQTGTALGGEAYNIDEVVECEAGARYKRLKVVED